LWEVLFDEKYQKLLRPESIYRGAGYLPVV
jgi:hypothetical protein